MIARRRLLLAFCAAAFAGAASAGETIDVYKSESCGCCAKWVEHLRGHGFQVRAHDVPEASRYRAKFGVPAMPLGSPGMEGQRNDPYDVLLIRKDGSTGTYARYGR